MPKVSIILPVYNAKTTISRCLDAILNNTYKDFEVICINDGSTDETLEILKQYKNKDSRIKILNQQNSGVGKARNYGIEKSLGEYLMFCDADDWYDSTMIEVMVHTIEKQNVDLVECDCNEINLGIIDVKEYGQYSKINGLKKVNAETIPLVSFVLWNKIYKKEILSNNKCQYPTKYEHDDTIFNFKYLCIISSMYGINEKLYNYVIGNPNSIMGKVITSNNKKNRFDFLWAWQDYIDYSRYILDKNRLDYCYKFMRGHISHFYNNLDSAEKKYFKKQLNLFKIKNKKLSNYLSFRNKSYLQILFSVINSADKRHKIITIFGIEFKFKIKNNAKTGMVVERE